MYKINWEQVKGKRRTRWITKVRHRLMRYLHRKGYSTTQIGKLLNRDHSTVVAALHGKEYKARKLEQYKKRCLEKSMEVKNDASLGN